MTTTTEEVTDAEAWATVVRNVRLVAKRLKGRRTWDPAVSWDDLFQEAMLLVFTLAKRHDAAKAKLSTYVWCSLPPGWGTRFSVAGPRLRRYRAERLADNRPGRVRFHRDRFELVELREFCEMLLGFAKRPRRKEILKDRFAIGRDFMTLQEAGRKYGITRECVRQQEQSALRDISNSPYVREYLRTRVGEMLADDPRERAAYRPDVIEDESAAFEDAVNLLERWGAEHDAGRESRGGPEAGL